MCDVIDRARIAARAAHAGQTDKAGRPYFEHPARVAARAFDAGCDDEVMAAAYLHDVIEDTALTVEDLYRMGFSPRVVRIVTAVTKVKGEPYYAAIQRACADPDARLVKWCDVMDNSDPARLALLDEATQDRLRHKYRKAREALELADQPAR